MIERRIDRVAGMLVHIISATQFPIVQDTTMENDTTLDVWYLDDRAYNRSGRWNARSHFISATQFPIVQDTTMENDLILDIACYFLGVYS
jgi:hypothetical protein